MISAHDGLTPPVRVSPLSLSLSFKHPPSQGHAAAQFEFPERMMDVCVDGRDLDSQGFGDAAVSQSLGNEPRDLGLLNSQRIDGHAASLGPAARIPSVRPDARSEYMRHDEWYSRRGHRRGR